MARGSEEDKGLGAALFEAGTRLVVRAAEKVLSDPRGQDAVARAIGLAQRGRRRVEQVQGQLMAAAGVPNRQDYQDLAKRLARIKRKARELSRTLEPEAGKGEPPTHGEGRSDGDGEAQ